jgi:hypothetical protein
MKQITFHHFSFFVIFGFQIVLVAKKRNVNDFFGNKKYALKHFFDNKHKSFWK